MNCIAVLTGDLVDSRSMRDTPAFLGQLKSVLGDMGQRYGAQVETFRGDGFQLVLNQPDLAFTCAVALRAALIAASPAGERWDARLALGIGQGEGNGSAYGEAFVLSGQGLDGMKKETLCLFSSDPQLLKYAALPTAFVEAIIENWTAVEAQTYFLHLTQGLDQRGIAERLGKSRVTVTKALQRASARLVDRYLSEARGWLEELRHA